MRVNRTKNGYRITVEMWSNQVVITEISTKKVIKTEQFRDHIQAVMVAKAL